MSDKQPANDSDTESTVVNPDPEQRGDIDPEVAEESSEPGDVGEPDESSVGVAGSKRRSSAESGDGATPGKKPRLPDKKDGSDSDGGEDSKTTV